MLKTPWDGGVTWSKDSEGFPWVSVSCQTNGVTWFPCKEHPSDKADGAEIIITAPEQLIAVGNGLLISKKTKRPLGQVALANQVSNQYL